MVAGGMRKILLLAFSLTMFAIGCGNADDAGANEKTVDAPKAEGPTFASVEPIFKQSCLPCHGDNGKDGVDMRTYESVMKGGEHGAIVKPGDPQNSLLVQVLRGAEGHERMPFKKDPLPEETIQQVEAWIKAGAKA
jgi:mono/diheme cytochrome c family protein